MILGIALTALLQGAVATPQVETVFGIEVGKPLSAPECQKGRWGFAEAPTSGMCWTGSESTTESPLGAVRSAHFKFAPDAQPQIAINVEATLIDGNVERVEFQTLGTLAIPVVMDALRAKYGKPSAEKKVPVQNRMGATFESVEAEWLRGGLSIVYLGVTHQIDRGVVTIDTKRGNDLRQLELDESRRKGTAL